MELLRNGRPRIVITGMGAVTALGDVASLWENLKAGQSGISRMENIETDYLDVKIAGEVKDFPSPKYISRKELRRMGRASHMAMSAATMAADDTGLTPETIEPMGERVATVVGTTMACHDVSEESTYKYRLDRSRKPNPLALMNSLPNMPGHYISRYLRAFGPLITPSAACASGTQAVGVASDLIRNGRADIVFTGGVEGILKDYIVDGFDAMGGLASHEFNDNPEKASRPFDAKRTGFVVAEGAAILVIESLENAFKRDAQIYAEILGYGTSSDAYHVAAIDPEGLGAIRSMTWALQDAQVNPEDINYVNAHGSSTPDNDRIETIAIKHVFGEHAHNIAINSTKSMIGHALGAAGTIEIITVVKSLLEKVLHPTINYETPDPDCDLDYVPNEARQVNKLDYAISNSFGLGGQNATIVLKAF